MRGAKKVMARIPVTEQLIRFLLCRRLRGARGHIYTFKAGQLCAEIFSGEDRIPQSCKVMVRRYLLSTLYEAVVHELTDKYRIVVQVNKAWELLACVEYEN
jgi:hypothetical protein